MSRMRRTRTEGAVKWLDAARIASDTGLSIDTVYRAARHGALRVTYINTGGDSTRRRCWRTTQAAVDAWLGVHELSAPAESSSSPA